MAIPSLNCHPKLHFPVRFHLVPIPLHFWKIGERFSPFYSSAMRNNRCRVIFLYSPICDPPCLQNTGMCGPVQRRFIYHRLAIPSLTPKFFNLFLWFTGYVYLFLYSPLSRVRDDCETALSLVCTVFTGFRYNSVLLLSHSGRETWSQFACACMSLCSTDLGHVYSTLSLVVLATLIVALVAGEKPFPFSTLSPLQMPCPRHHFSAHFCLPASS